MAIELTDEDRRTLSYFLLDYKMGMHIDWAGIEQELLKRGFETGKLEAFRQSIAHLKRNHLWRVNDQGLLEETETVSC